MDQSISNAPGITPPLELVQQWEKEAVHERDYNAHLATRAAQWGADQELEACCHCFARDLRESLALELRARRRPKPPSLKEQAIAVLEDAELNAAHYNILLRALEQLDD
jgi:hypothetical protein